MQEEHIQIHIDQRNEKIVYSFQNTIKEQMDMFSKQKMPRNIMKIII